MGCAAARTALLNKRGVSIVCFTGEILILDSYGRHEGSHLRADLDKQRDPLQDLF
jgi:hypothetical protein